MNIKLEMLQRFVSVVLEQNVFAFSFEMTFYFNQTSKKDNKNIK